MMNYGRFVLAYLYVGV